MSSHIAAMRRSFALRRPYRRVFCRVVSGAFAARTSVRAERATGCTFAAGRIAGDFGYRTATIKADDQRGRQFGGGQPDDHSDAELRVGKFDDRHHRSRHREPSVSHRSRCAVAGSRSQHRANWRTRRSDVGVHPRDQLQPRQGPDRRHRRFRSQQSEPVFRFRPVADRRHCPHRSAARAAKRPLRLGRDRRRHCDHDQKGSGPPK